MSNQISTYIDIPAPATEVWAQLTDLAAYASWNPFVLEAAGDLRPGERLRLRIQPPGTRGMRLRPTVTALEEGRVFEWLGHLGVPGLFDGRHRFELHDSGTGTRLVHSESFTGILARPVLRAIAAPTRDGFAAMNAALARRVADQRAAA